MERLPPACTTTRRSLAAYSPAGSAILSFSDTALMLAQSKERITNVKDRLWMYKAARDKDIRCDSFLTLTPS